MKAMILPRNLVNGCEALRILDYYKYTAKEASYLFKAIRQFHADEGGREIFSLLEYHLETLLILETHGLLDHEEWKSVIKDTNDNIEDLLHKLQNRTWLSEPTCGFRLIMEYAA